MLFFDDSRFLGCDFGKRVAQQGHVVESDVGDDAHDRDDEVGGVQPSAQSRFDDGDLDVALVEVVEGEGRGHLEERESELLHAVVVFVHEVHDFLLGDHLSVHEDPFAEIAQVRRGVEPRAVARLLEYRGEHVRHGAFAVGAGHVDREIVALGIAQVLAECGDAFQSGFIGFGPLLLVRNER